MNAPALPALYVLAEDYRNAATQLSDMDLTPECVADTLESLAGDLEVKATNVAMFVRNLESLAEQIKSAENQMDARRKAIENRATHVREYLMSNMLRAGISKIECPYFKLSIRDNPPSVVIDDTALIPGEFMRQAPPPPSAPDKTAIKAAITTGQDVPGTHLERGQRLEIK